MEKSIKKSLNWMVGVTALAVIMGSLRHQPTTGGVTLFLMFAIVCACLLNMGLASRCRTEVNLFVCTTRMTERDAAGLMCWQQLMAIYQARDLQAASVIIWAVKSAGLKYQQIRLPMSLIGTKEEKEALIALIDEFRAVEKFFA
jgi:hypothetical protein